LAEDSKCNPALQMSRIRLSCEMCFWRLIEPKSTGQVRAVMAQTVKSSDFVLGSSCAGLHFGLVVVAVKGVVSIDPLVITVRPDQLNYGTQPKGAMISRREDRVGSLQVLSLERRPLTRPPAEKELAPPNLSSVFWEFISNRWINKIYSIRSDPTYRGCPRYRERTGSTHTSIDYSTDEELRRRPTRRDL
jgi:hypothetical protein